MTALPVHLPAEVRLSGWLGPTLFSPEPAGDRVDLTALFRGAPPPALVGARVVGSIRETDGEPTRHAVFCLQPTTGELWLADLAAPFTVRFVNASLERFERCVAAFVAAWSGLQHAERSDLARIRSELRQRLDEIDPEAFRDADAYWPTWLDDEAFRDD